MRDLPVVTAAELLPRILGAASLVFEREVRATDDFFSLGGDSLTAVELVLRLEEIVQVEVDSEVVVSAPNFAAVAAVLAQDLRTTHHGDAEVAETGGPLESAAS